MWFGGDSGLVESWYLLRDLQFDVRSVLKRTDLNCGNGIGSYRNKGSNMFREEKFLKRIFFVLNVGYVLLLLDLFIVTVRLECCRKNLLIKFISYTFIRGIS
jgi:hypothetical protein